MNRTYRDPGRDQLSAARPGQGVRMARVGFTSIALAFGLGIGASEASAQMSEPPSFLVTSPSSHDFNQTLALLKQAIEGENLMVVHEIDPQQMLRMVGVRTEGMRQILFFHPRFMRQILEANPNGGIEPPLKILVMERPDGTVVLRYHDPADLFAPYAGLEAVSRELKGVVERIAASVR